MAGQSCRRISNNFGEIACELMGLTVLGLMTLVVLTISASVSLIKLENISFLFNTAILLFILYRIYAIIDRAMQAEDLIYQMTHLAKIE